MATMKDSISKDCWEVIRDNYEKGSYTTAIINLIQYINEVCREKTGLPLDNTKLMEKAFLGDKPSLLINKFETQTEKNIQEGIGYLMKGVCLAIRNPRSHERYSDDQKTATTIILFLDYILGFIRNSKQSNLIDDWTEIIFDENFSENPKYSEELFNAMPKNKKMDILIMVFRNSDRIKSRNVMPFIKLIIDSMTEKEKAEYFELMSKFLIKATDNDQLRKFFMIFPDKYWHNISKLAKIRIESMVKKSVENGTYCTEYDNYGNIEEYYLSSGQLAISAMHHIPMFENKNEIYEIFGDIMMSEDVDKIEFLREFRDLFYIDADDIVKCDSLNWAIDASISKDKKNKWIVAIVKDHIKWKETKSWIENFETTFDDVFEIKKVEPITDEELPF